MRVVLPLLLLLLAMAVVFGGIWIAALRARVGQLTKTLAGLEDPKAWLSDEDRRKYALELLNRDTAEYQASLIRRYEDQIKQFNTPTQGEGSK